MVTEGAAQSRRLCVFCGSAMGSDAATVNLARNLGHHLADAGVGMVYGGASVGLMGVMAEAVLERGGEAIGVIPESLVDREIAHPGLSQLHVVAGMHERKRLMYDLADGFCALPGGYGTLDEIFEAVTWSQLGLHDQGRRKRVVLLSGGGFWSGLTDFLDAAVDAGFVKQSNRDLVGRADSPEEALSRLFAR